MTILTLDRLEFAIRGVRKTINTAVVLFAELGMQGLQRLRELYRLSGRHQNVIFRNSRYNDLEAANELISARGSSCLGSP
jgi:hypothetical protein